MEVKIEKGVKITFFF